MLITALDRSGSMRGEPIEALKRAALLIGKKIANAKTKPFEHFISLSYDDKLSKHEYYNKEKYEAWAKNLYARGQTDFKVVFNEITRLAEKKTGITELTVIFFTDGKDTCNYHKTLNQQLKAMSERFKTNFNVTSRFLSIGFSANHDAAFMGAVAEAGIERGNFTYVNTSNENYQQDVTNSLTDALDMAMEGAGGL
jgi:uncharacterized protein YegL